MLATRPVSWTQRPNHHYIIKPPDAPLPGPGNGLCVPDTGWGTAAICGGLTSATCGRGSAILGEEAAGILSPGGGTGTCCCCCGGLVAGIRSGAGSSAAELHHLLLLPLPDQVSPPPVHTVTTSLSAENHCLSPKAQPSNITTRPLETLIESYSSSKWQTIHTVPRDGKLQSTSRMCSSQYLQGQGHRIFTSSGL